MEIRILELIEGAKKAEGLTVIIDVFRAFSLECYLYARGASAVFPAGSVEEARHMKQVHPEYLLIGERWGRRCEGFDYGNSPSQTRDADLSGKKIVHTTSAGTQGIVNAVHAEEILTGSLVNARAVADYSIPGSHGKRRRKDCKGGCDLRPVYQMSSGGQTLPYRRGNTVPEDSRRRTFL